MFDSHVVQLLGNEVVQLSNKQLRRRVQAKFSLVSIGIFLSLWRKNSVLGTQCEPWKIFLDEELKTCLSHEPVLKK